MQSAENPVENGQHTAEISIEMLWVHRMVDLMMRGAHHYTAQQTGKWNPNMRMLQVNDEVDCQNHEYVGIPNRKLMGSHPRHTTDHRWSGRDRSL